MLFIYIFFSVKGIYLRKLLFIYLSNRNRKVYIIMLCSKKNYIFFFKNKEIIFSKLMQKYSILI